jgi:predicted alpha/beta superfamily hydrolase
VVTLHLGLTRPDAFGRLAVVSPSLWWDDKLLIKNVKKLAAKLDEKVWVDIGTEEGPDSVANTLELRDAMVEKGWKEGRDLLVYVDGGAVHNEGAWASRFGEILMWLFPARP